MAANKNHKIHMLFLLFAVTTMHAKPVRQISDLDSITFFERTGGLEPSRSTFAVNSVELSTRVAGTLNSNNADIEGVPGQEFYDVFYSNADGAFNIDGEFITIEGEFRPTDSAQSGLNLAEMELNFSTGETELANFVASFVALGNSADPASVGNAIDGDPQTHTRMGTTLDTSERLRVTLGFLSSSGNPGCLGENFSRCCEQAGSCCVKVTSIVAANASTCVQVSESSCSSLGGIFFGVGSSCAIGACIVNEMCARMPESECKKLSGEYQGDNTNCEGA